MPDLLDLLPLAQTFARPLLSGFSVGAVVQGMSGSLYMGANFEVPGHALALTAHAEQAALANAYSHGESGIAAIAVTAAPCGHCRQFLHEFSPDGDVRVLIREHAATTLSALLPAAFGPKDLGRAQGALPIRRVDLSLRSPSEDSLTHAALEAARNSYAPYTLSHSGIAILISDGRVFTGSYIENVAFNPSFSPLHSALAGLFAAGGHAADIVKATLVEVEGAKISQQSITQSTLASLVPRAPLELLFVR